jgi:hypothetical protein
LETLTPVQRVAVIAICLALTALVALFLVPWVWTQIVERLPITATQTPGAMLWPAGPTVALLVQGSPACTGALLA